VPSSELEALARDIAHRAEAGEQIEAFVSRVRETEIKVFGGSVEALTVAERSGVGVRVIVGGRQGFAWAGSLEPEVVEFALREARDNVAFAAPDEWQGLVTPDEAAGAPPDLDLWRAELAAVPIDAKVAIALDLEAATLAAHPMIRGVEQSVYDDAMVEAAVASSVGVTATSRRTMCSCAAFALAGEGGETQTGYGFSAARSFADLDVPTAARDAADRATRLLGATQPKSQRLPIVFDPLVTRSLLAVVGGALGGESIVKGRSMFVDRAGEMVAAAGVTLVDDPTNPDAFGAATHDSEGVPARRNELIVDGELRGFLHNAYTGRRSAAGTTGSAVRGGFATTPGTGARALSLVPGALQPSEILERSGDALYVQSVSGLHSGTNPVSGDFSVGAEGAMVRGGELAEPVREATIASTLPRMLGDITEVGADLTWLPGGAAGMTLLVGEMTMSGA
jgi:PmbA protein